MKRAWTRGEKWLWATPLLIGILAGSVMLWPEVVRRATGRPQILPVAPGTNIRSMALSRNGEVLAAGGLRPKPRGWKPGSGTVYLWNARTAEPLKPFPPVYARDPRGFMRDFEIYALALSPDGKRIGFARSPQPWTLYDVATQKSLWTFPESIADAEFSHDGRFIALYGLQISIVSATDGKIHARWNRSRPANSADLTWSPDGTLVANIGSYKTGNPIEVRRVADGKLVNRIQSPKILKGETVASVAFSPDSKQLVVASSPGSFKSTDNFNMYAPLRCYNTVTGKLVWEMKAPSLGKPYSTHASFCDAIFSPDGRFVAAYQYLRGQVLLLNSMTGAVERTLQLGKVTHSVFFVPPGLAYSPDGKRLFARGKDAMLLWDLE